MTYHEDLIQQTLKSLYDDLIEAENGPDRNTFGFKNRLKEIYDELLELEEHMYAIYPQIGEYGALDPSFESCYHTRGDSGMAQLLKSRIKKWMILTESSKTEVENENEFLAKPKLHEKIVKASKKLFDDGHYSQAIFEAVKVLEKEIKTKSDVKDKSGVPLVNHVFNEKHPIIKIVEGDDQEYIDEREGFRFLYMGAFLGIKNPKSHSVQNLNEPDKALEYLSFISLLLRRLDEAKMK